MSNLVGYVEIPASDLARATAFYEAVFGIELERAVIDGYEMSLFPFSPDAPGCSAALVVGDVYVPAKAGPVVYMKAASIERTLARARTAGARVLLERKAVGDMGFVAEIEDSEGNRIGLHEPP